MKLNHGKHLMLKKEVAGKPRIVRVLSSDPENEWLIEIGGEGRSFFMNRVMIERCYTDKGLQMELFRQPSTMKDIWKKRHIKA